MFMTLYRHLSADIRQMRAMPKVSVNLMRASAEQNHPFFVNLVDAFYSNTRRRHPKLLVVRRFEYGVAICTLPESHEHYLRDIDASARRNLKKAERNGYVFQRIPYNDYLKDIKDIRSSTSHRQGRMPEAFLTQDVRPVNNPESQLHYHDYPYFGVVRDGRLYAYAGCFISGEACFLEHIYGHAQYQSDAVVPLLLIGIVRHLMQAHPAVKHFVYDTYFGASESMRRFKSKFGFAPHHVTWLLDGAHD